MNKSIYKKCLGCGKKIKVLPCRINTHKYCSLKCKYKHNRVSKVCPVCKKKFEVYNCFNKKGRLNFCSRQCSGVYASMNYRGINAHRWNGGKIETKCLFCGKTFFIGKSIIEIGKGKFCSKKCEGSWRSKNIIGKSSYSWKGGIKLSSHGYRMIYCSEHPQNTRNYVYEHRLIIEKIIGRYLTKKEVIHHINGKKTDNRIINLIGFNDNGSHKTYHKTNKIDANKIFFNGREYDHS